MVFKDHRSHLAHLVRLCIIAATLQIDFFLNTAFAKNVMTTADALRKT